MLALEARTQLGALALDVALTAEPGECLAVAGLSGAGKTSVLRIVAGLLRPDEGTVRCGDAVWLDTARGIDVPPDRRRCGYLFQEHALFPTMSAWRNVAYPLGRPHAAAKRRAHAAAKRRAHDLLDRFGVGHLADARPATLSGGERQRVALARALARRPEALLLDEPLSALDARSRADATRALADALRDAGVPSLLVTHDFAEAATLGDRVAVIDGGRIVQAGPAAELAAAPATAFVADFTGAVVLLGTARAAADGLTRVELDGGGEAIASTDVAEGPVAASVFPWEIAIDRADAPPAGSAQNRIRARVVTVTTVGNRVRLGLQAGQPLAAEVTRTAVERLDLAPGASVVASWKATATRLARR